MKRTVQRPLRLFVYGTLRSDGPAHAEYCLGRLDVLPAVVEGSLERIPPGYPILVVPRRTIFGRRSSSPEGDLALQEEWAKRLAREPAPRPLERGIVDGEILLFDDTDVRLERLDVYEDVLPDGGGLYDRVLVRAWERGSGLARPVWAYVRPGIS